MYLERVVTVTAIAHLALAHKRRVLERLLGLARQAELRDPDGLAGELLLLMEGAWVAARMFGPDNYSRLVAKAARDPDRGTRGGAAGADRAGGSRTAAKAAFSAANSRHGSGVGASRLRAFRRVQGCVRRSQKQWVPSDRDPTRAAGAHPGVDRQTASGAMMRVDPPRGSAQEDDDGHRGRDRDR